MWGAVRAYYTIALICCWGLHLNSPPLDVYQKFALGVEA